MIFYCKKCGKKVAELAGSKRPGSVMLCAECYERLDIADTIARNVTEKAESKHKHEMPEFFKEIFK
jgi:protein-arginine kinase activator protein McsA